MEITKKDVMYPVDSIIDCDDYIAICSYNYIDGKRNGLVQLINKNTKEITAEFPTSGTFCGAYKDGKIYTADSNHISMFTKNKMIKKLPSTEINTYIELDDNILVTDIKGYLNFYDYDLNFIKNLKISDDPLWVCKTIKGKVYIGCENGYAYVYDLKNHTIKNFGEKRYGILYFLEDKGRLYVTSYDDNIVVYEIETLKEISTIKKIGSVWNLIKKNEKFYCACMYDGLKIYDNNWSLLDHYPTNSICYGLCLDENYVYWSSFYDRCIFYKLI